MFNVERLNEKGEIEIAICPICNLRLEFICSPMVRRYSTGETYEQPEIVWTLKSKVSKDIEFDVENVRGNDLLQDFLPNAHQLPEEIEA